MYKARAHAATYMYMYICTFMQRYSRLRDSSVAVFDIRGIERTCTYVPHATQILLSARLHDRQVLFNARDPT